MSDNINIKIEQIELWKDIGVIKDVDYTGYYQVSNKGRVRSLDRAVSNINGVTYHYKERILSLKPGIRGYVLAVMSINNRPSAVSIHRLVAIAFIPNPFNKPQVNHIDGDKENNNVENLEWCTAKENIRHAIKFGGRRSALRAEKNIVIKLYKNGQSTAEIGKIYNVRAEAVHKVLKINNVAIRSRTKAYYIKAGYDEKRVINLYQSNLSMRRVAKKMGLTYNIVRNILKINNIKIRSQSKAALMRETI